MHVAFFSTLKLIPVETKALSLDIEKSHRESRANDSKSEYRDTVSSMHFYFHVKISENTAKQIITAFHFCVFLKLFHHNATQMLVGLGYLFKKKTMPLIPRTCLWTQRKKNCVQLASVSTSQGILKFMTGIRIVPSPEMTAELLLDIEPIVFCV